jgi:hypothetical protein
MQKALWGKFQPAIELRIVRPIHVLFGESIFDFCVLQILLVYKLANFSQFSRCFLHIVYA